MRKSLSFNVKRFVEDEGVKLFGNSVRVVIIYLFIFFGFVELFECRI